MFPAITLLVGVIPGDNANTNRSNDMCDINYNRYTSRDNFIASIKAAIDGMNPDTDTVHDTVTMAMTLFNGVYRTNYGVTGKNTEYFFKYADKVHGTR